MAVYLIAGGDAIIDEGSLYWSISLFLIIRSLTCFTIENHLLNDKLEHAYYLLPLSLFQDGE